MEQSLDHEPFDLEFIQRVVDTSGTEGLTEQELEFYNNNMVFPADPSDHYANLAELMEDHDLRKIATDVINWVDWDEESREDWEIRESKGIRLLGISDRTEGGAKFKGATKVVHPLLAEAVTQFHSRAIAELWPPEGPVKTAVIGSPTPELNAQAERVQDYMNYQYTSLMPGAFEEADQLLFRLPISGSCFKKVCYDPLEREVVTRLVEPADFIVPYSAMDLRTAPRFTHRLREMHNDVLKKIQSGHYRDVYVGTPLNEDYDYPQQLEEIDHTEGRERVLMDDDQRHTVHEMYVDLDLPGYEDADRQGNTTGIALPYIVTVDRDEQVVLRIQRNWREDDPLKRKRIYFSHYKFTPGYGFYGYGLLHLIGGLSNAATGSLRALLDSAQYANLQGGFKTMDSKIEGGKTPIAPGEWREVRSSIQDLRNGFFPIPHKEPSIVLFNLLNYLDERGQRFASTTENMVGDANNSAPVGTTLALIEQGSKVFSAIHKRLHQAQSREFRIVAELNYEYLPNDGYPYATPGSDSSVMASDFDGRIDVIPVSDPNIISSTQRIAQAQAILNLSEKFPDVIGRRKAVEVMLKAMKVSDFEGLMMPEQEDNPEDDIKRLEVDKMKAEIDKVVAETANENIKTQFSSVQTSQNIHALPGVVASADELLKSAGYVDKNGPPIAGQPDFIPMQEGEENTDPRFPPIPESPQIGAEQGIKTQEQDSVI